MTNGSSDSAALPHKLTGTREKMTQNRLEIWVIDAVARRRSHLTTQLGQMGYSALPLDPDDQFPESFGRAVIAMVNDDTAVVDRVLDWRTRQPISCVVYSDSLKAKRAADLVRRGVTDLMDWPCQKQDMAEAVSTAEAGLSATHTDTRRSTAARDLVEALSPREMDVLGGIMAGKTSRQIADALQISIRTVEVHRINCFRRLGVNATSDAVLLGKASGCFKYAVEI